MTHKFKKISDKCWIIEVEEDPQTEELFLAIPPEALAQVGWDFGDTLTWKIDPLTHQITLEKKK